MNNTVQVSKKMNRAVSLRNGEEVSADLKDIEINEK